MQRQYYEDINYKPFLFYVIFGVSGDELEVSRTKHHVEEFPHGLDMQLLCRDKNSEYLDGFFEGAMGNVLKESNNELYNRCKQSNKCAIIRGQIDNDATFDYMRNVVGFIQAFIDQGACGILDLLTVSLISPVEWTERFLKKKLMHKTM